MKLNGDSQLGGPDSQKKRNMRLPIDEIKIDRKFIRNIDQHEKQSLLVKSIFEIAHGLNLNVVAEGVETTSEKALLIQMGCDDSRLPL
ncbi:EAL domain-containing protein [Fredinandcohnia humi]